MFRRKRKITGFRKIVLAASRLLATSAKSLATSLSAFHGCWWLLMMLLLIIIDLERLAIMSWLPGCENTHASRDCFRVRLKRSIKFISTGRTSSLVWSWYFANFNVNLKNRHSFAVTQSFDHFCSKFQHKLNKFLQFLEYYSQHPS